MPNPLVECIPNFSEARRPEVVEAIVQAINEVPGVHILDRHSDMDHNRTVITFIGSPDAVEQAAFQSIAKASQLIDLNHHTGEHPRIGATDVVPFVPISDITMQECVEMARQLGKRVADEVNIPVYLYEDAASRPERQNLENIRRGQYEGLKSDILVNPDRKPDFGPAELGPAGATVIGARQPLIAYNIYLTTEDVSIAQKIAKAIRNSSGGLRFVKAMGVLVEGRAQVSMNLTNFRQTPIARVVELVRREATRYGVGIHHSELVGLIPQEALNDAAVWYTQLDAFQSDQILEQRLYEVLSGPKPEAPAVSESFLEELASGTPTPGGGSAAAHAGAIGAALAAMVARLTVGKKKYANVEQQMWTLVEKADNLRKTLTLAIDEDAAAFTGFMQATRLSKDTEEQQAARTLAIQQATLEAARVPLKVAGLAIEVMKLTLEAARFGNLNAISDAASGFSMARASLNSAGVNVRINLQGLDDPTPGQPMLDQITRLERTARDLLFELRRVLADRSDMTLPD
jgi:glutamate formiminotransferase/formiminotetrahydrofolate cyclodeaminase